MVSVLFVCLGNICRSPTAEVVFAARVAQAGLTEQFIIDSAGIGGWHVGEPPDQRAVSAALYRGYHLESLRARQVEVADFHRFQFILAMDRQNLAGLEELKPSSFDGELGLFLQYVSGSSMDEVLDPYFGSTFDPVLDQVEDAADGLLCYIRESVEYR